MSITSNSENSVNRTMRTQRHDTVSQFGVAASVIGALLAFFLAFQLLIPVVSVPIALASALIGALSAFVIVITVANTSDETAAKSAVRHRRILFAVFVVMFLSFVLGSASILQAFAGIANAFITSWDVLFNAYVLPFQTSGGFGYVDMGLIVVFFGSLSALFVWGLLRMPSHAVSFIVLVMVVLACVFAGIANVFTVGGLVAGSLMMFAVKVSAKRGIVMTVGNVATSTFVDMRIGGRRNNLFASIPLFFVVIAVFMVVAAGLMANLPDWQNASGMRQHLMESIDELRYGTDTLPEGNLVESALMNVAEEDTPQDRLEITFADAGQSEVAYFRGFTGSNYTGLSFKQATYIAYTGEWNGLFSWLDGLGFDPLTQSALFGKLNKEEQRQDAQEFDVGVSTLEANRRYGYAPYQALNMSNESQLFDLYLLPTGFLGLDQTTVRWLREQAIDESYTVPHWVSHAGASGETLSATEAFLEAEHAYRQFVHETYTDVDDAVSSYIDEFFYTGSDWDGSVDDLYGVTTRIRSILEAKCSFSYAPEFIDPALNNDFVEWFLYDSRRGNSAAFASAAVLAYREQGIPARYVEGYVLGPSSVRDMRAAGTPSIVLTDHNAHAWVEVYLDGAGWTPIEVTPGFYDKTYSTDQTIEISREVAGDGSESDTSGSLEEDKAWDDWIPEALRPFAWIGLVLLVVILLLLAYAIAELQRTVRLRLYRRRLDEAIAESESESAGAHAAGVARVSSMLYHRLLTVMRLSKFPFDEDRPFESSTIIAASIPEIRLEEYDRAIELIERERFGADPLTRHEVTIVESVIDRIEAHVWRSASPWQHLRMRYGYLFTLPL